ncbi:MAG TPA: hypothetical protein VKA36_06180 [Solirubrobacterales bacterium]|nr:hypothetical protein [Solirubrobacterales bacterium]
MSPETDRLDRLDRARERLRELAAERKPDAGALSRARRELLSAAYLAGRSYPEDVVETGELWEAAEGVEQLAEVAEDLAWALARQAEQLEAREAVEDPEPLDPDVVFDLDRGRWQQDVARARHARLEAEARAGYLARENDQLRERLRERERRIADRERRLEERRAEISRLRAARPPERSSGGLLRRLRRGSGR